MSKSPSNKFLKGASLLQGDNTIPGLGIPEELKKLIPTIIKNCREFGLDFYDVAVQMLDYGEMAEVCSYGGFPVRFPHWKWGMEYEEFQRGYEYNMHRVYEIVINTNPCYIFCLDSNTLVDNVTVIAHAIGHNDFFKNNIYFSQTNQNMMNELANHGSRIRRYMQGRKEEVVEFIDHCMRLETLIDPAKAWDRKEIKDRVYTDKREYEHPGRLPVGEDKDHMDPFINPKEWTKEQRKEIERRRVAKAIGAFSEPTKDIMGFLRDYAPLKPWQQDILAMLYEESMYFAPQRLTKMANEGWASFTDHTIIADMGLVSLGQNSHDVGIVEYAKHKMGVLGGKYSMNPYKLGYELFLDIEERWNKGKFGDEYDSCEDMRKREAWDTNLGLGREKIFDVRKFYNDFSMINEFFTEEFCRKMEFFEWKKYPNGEYRITTRDYQAIKRNLEKRYINGGLPDIRLTDPNHRGKGHLLLQHQWDGRTLYDKFVRPTIQSLQKIWNNRVLIATRNGNDEEVLYYCDGPKDEQVKIVTREEYESE